MLCLKTLLLHFFVFDLRFELLLRLELRVFVCGEEKKRKFAVMKN